ncbi:MAG: hypothetical protein ACJ72N_22025 [Labedaea sp.]
MTPPTPRSKPPTSSRRRPSAKPDDELEQTTTPPLVADPPGFEPPRRAPVDELDPDVTTVSPPADPLEPATPGADSWPAAPSGEEELLEDFAGDEGNLDEPGPTTTSRGVGRSPGLSSPDVFQPPIAGLVALASLGVHTARRAPGALWLADDDDVANISAPLARIAARHSPIAGGEANDLADGIEAAVATANYAVKNMRAEAEARAGGFVEEGPPAPAEEPNGAQPYGFPPTAQAGPA